MREISSKEIEIIRDLDPHLGEVLLDPKGIHRCLLNMISNAIDACLEDSVESKHYRVQVITRREGEKKFMFQVSDNGCGIEDEAKAHLFTSFFSTKGSKGTGLGLLITQKIVQEHGGTLSLNSEPGQGSVFTMLLPVKSHNNR